jgi:hypothetical protein
MIVHHRVQAKRVVGNGGHKWTTFVPKEADDCSPHETLPMKRKHIEISALFVGEFIYDIVLGLLLEGES